VKYQPFAADPDSLSARIVKHDPAVTDAGHAVADASIVLEPPKTLAALTALRDTTFVRAAYRVMLRRDAEPAGLDHYTRQLRSGGLDKVEILGQLRYSAEGRKHPVDIAGLDWRYRLRRAGRVPGIGWAVRWVTSLVRLGSSARTAQNHQGILEEHAAAIQKILGEVRDVRAQLQSSSTAIQHAEGVVAELTGEIRALSRRLAAYQEHATSAVPSTVPVTTSTQAAADDLDDWYVGFEDHFRGTREETKRAQEIYLGYVAAAAAGSPSAPLLDLGCGRGEWLELLKERGYVARGVDANARMIRENRDRGLDVVEQEVLDYLTQQPDASVGMVTGFHLIEHLRIDVLVRLFDEARRVLKSGGCILFETPNPENLVVGAYTFYLDPTHRHPLPPQLIEHFTRGRGFADVEIVRLHPRDEPGADTALLDRWFRGPTDYAVVGWKDGKRPAR
jgi:O-antigen chain-terminating methyltransferase